MKGIILHGGAGSRLRPLTFSGPKQLIPLANKPISQYVVEDLALSNIQDIAIILGENFTDVIKKHYGNGDNYGCNITYINQGKPLGLAQATGLCKDFIGDDIFVVYLADNLLQFGIKQYFEEFKNNDYDALLLLKEVKDPRSFGVAEFNEKGKLIGLVEKPQKPPSNFALIGVYFLKPIIFDMINKLKPSWRGEYEITEALQMLIEQGYKVEYRKINGYWLDTGKKDEILSANALILDEKIKRDIKGELINSNVEGRVTIGESTEITGSTVRGPVIIGKNCVIKNSFIGPYTSVDNNANIINSNIEYSVLLENVMINGINRLEESLVGKSSKILKSEGNGKNLKLTIGDYSEIII